MIRNLPGSVSKLRQLQILDVRYTSIVALPVSITKLKKLQYIRAGTTTPLENRKCLQLVGVQMASGVGKLTLLHTLGVVNISAAKGKIILEELKNLTQLRKLGVAGASKSNSKELCSAISDHSHLQSLSVWLDKGDQGCLDCMPGETSRPPKKLQSLKLYGPLEKLPMWIRDLCNLRKLNLEVDVLSKDDIGVLGNLQELCILRLRVNTPQDAPAVESPASEPQAERAVTQLQGTNYRGDSSPQEEAIPLGMLSFCIMINRVEDRCYKKIQVLEIASRSMLHLSIGKEAMENLEVLKAGCYSARSLPQFGSLNHLKKLKEVQVIGSLNDEQKRDLKNHFEGHPSKPALTTREVNPSAQASIAGKDETCSFPFTPTSPSHPAK